MLRIIAENGHCARSTLPRKERLDSPLIEVLKMLIATIAFPNILPCQEPRAQMQSLWSCLTIVQ